MATLTTHGSAYHQSSSDCFVEDRSDRYRDEIAEAIRRVRHGFGDRSAHAWEVAFEARRRQLRDGQFEVDVDLEPDGSFGGGGYIFPTAGGPEQALVNRGYDPSDPDVEAVMFDATSHAESVAGDAAKAGSPWGCREEEHAHRTLMAPDHEAGLQARSVLRESRLPLRYVRRASAHCGRAPRFARNARRRGSRRTSSRAGPGDDPGPSDEPPPSGWLTADDLALPGGLL